MNKIVIYKELFETCSFFGDDTQRAKALSDVLKHFFEGYNPNLNACGHYLLARVKEEVERQNEISEKRAKAGYKGGKQKKQMKAKKANAFCDENESLQVVEIHEDTSEKAKKANAFQAESGDYIYNINNNNNNILKDKDIYKEEKYKKEETKNNQMVLLINGEDISECKGSEDEERWSKDIPQPWHSLLMFWCRHKARIGKRYKCKQPIKARYKELIEFSNNDPTTAASIIEQSINNGWEGLFKLNQNGDNRKHTIETEREQRGKEHAAMLASLLEEGRSNSEADADNTSGVECF